MRKLVMFSIAVGVAAVVGCGRTDTADTRTYSTPVGTVTVTTEEGESEVALTFGEGKVEIRGKESAAGGSATGESGVGTVKIAPGVSEKDLGIPLYPGATVIVTEAGTSRAEGAFASVHLSTSDPVEKVKQFYQRHLPGADMEESTLNSLGLGPAFGRSGPHRSATIVKTEGGVRTSVRISSSEDPGMRRIMLSRREIRSR